MPSLPHHHQPSHASGSEQHRNGEQQQFLHAFAGALPVVRGGFFIQVRVLVHGSQPSSFFG